MHKMRLSLWIILLSTSPLIDGFAVRSPLVPTFSAATHRQPRIQQQLYAATEGDEGEKQAITSVSGNNKDGQQQKTRTSASKREMLSFAIPALGIYLSNPLLSNIDNAFVGKTVGTQGLAALSPATIATDQMLYLFSFLSRATTSLVSRAYGKQEGETKQAQAEAARQAGSAPLTVSLVCGVFLSIFYAFCTPKLLSFLHVNPALRTSASSYIYWRGSIAWAALAQAAALSTLMATRDAITPLKIIGLAAIVNVIGDFLFCVFPFQLGCSGAAAATSFATLFSCGFMVKALKKKGLLPSLRFPTKQEWNGLLEFTGPLLAITVTRLIGFVSMQRTAMSMGVQHTAAYQLSINLILFFLLFGEPLSQLSQTQLPALVDAQDGSRVKATFKSVLLLGLFTALGTGAIAAMTLYFGAGLFTSDLAVQALAKGATPALFMTVATAIFAVTVDGANLASRDFKFMLGQGVLSMLIQLKLLTSWCSSLSDIFATFTIRLGSYALISLLRTALGRGRLGRVIKHGATGIPGIKAVNGAASPSSSPKLG